MKVQLTKVSLALLSAVFVLGCQDLGTEPVESYDLAPQFNKPDQDGKHDHGDGGSEQATVMLTQGMVMDPLQASGKDDDLRVGLAVFFVHDITMTSPKAAR